MGIERSLDGNQSPRSQSSSTAARFGFRQIWPTTVRALTKSWDLIRSGGAPLFSSMLIILLLVALLAFPLIGWLFREAARSAGMVAIDLHTLHLGGNITITFVLLIAVLTVAFWATSAQLLVTAVALRNVAENRPAAGRSVWKAVWETCKKLAHFNNWSLGLYLLIMLPLSGLGFASVITEGLAVPPFITGELMKAPLTAALLTAAALVLFYANVRFLLAVPIFALSDAGGSEAMRRSWRLTRGWRVFPLLLAGLVYLLVGGLLTGLLLTVAVIPTAIADAAAPQAAPVVAGISVALAHGLSLLITAFVTAGILGASMSLVRQLDPLEQEAPAPVARAVGDSARVHRSSMLFVVGLIAAMTVVSSFSWVPAMQRLSEHPTTLVLGHRGFSDGGVENTIPGLEAAHAAGADLVEMDVMETKDGQFVVMHDPNLGRLAGKDLHVKDLTLEELTQITVHDQFGHEAKIPSVEDYVIRAQELDQRLLMEIKLGGADSPDHVERLLAQLEQLGVAENNIYHTLDYDSAEKLKSLRPDLTVGYILPVAGLGVPDTSADFLVVEQESATPSLQQETKDAGLGFFVWTVDDSEEQRIWLRQDADGMITDHPDVALESRQQIQDERGMVDSLVDVLRSFIVVF